ncbi:MAG: hypothetical protein HYY23_03410 [Verrucomicrobia bacterium]|nr:hypothetical protein [Verrucomicrobiota bacterium]
MNNMRNTQDLISAAVPLYVGYGITPFPKEDGERLVREFGPEVGRQLELKVKQVLGELDQLKPDWSAHTLVSASRWAGTELSDRHPELDAKAVAALEWIFSWWWK